MGKYCEICEKGTLNGNNVSHSNRKSHRIWAPNVQSRGNDRDWQLKHQRNCQW